MKQIMMLVVVIAGLCLYAQQVITIDVPSPTVTVIKPLPRYNLIEAVGVAVDTVPLKGKQLTVQNVMSELEAMEKVNDVELPYGYTHVSTNPRGFLNGKNKKRKAEVELLVSRMIARKRGENVQPELPLEPLPKDFKTRDDFRNAYVQYKLAHVDDEVKEKYAKKLGGMNQYKRDMKAEAGAIWKSFFGAAGVNSAMMPSKVQK